MPLIVTSQEKMPDIYVLYPVGSLDTNTYQVLEKKVDYLIGEGQAKVITLDMTGVHYLSSMGIRVVIKAKKQLQQRGGSLIMMNLQPQVQKVFEIIKALPSLRIFSSINELDDYLTEMQRQTIHGKE
ncbi:MAG: STAS domain-containing protein [Syntrophobacteraceae bacterium]|jgi:anti-anti-sigma factor